MKWDKTTWTPQGTLVMYSKTLVSCWGRRIDLHKIVSEDDVGCYHSHPANAVRLILLNSYWEELPDGMQKKWTPGMIGRVPGPMSHRIHLVGEPCYTLWFRGKNRFKVELTYGQEEGESPTAEHTEDAEG